MNVDSHPVSGVDFGNTPAALRTRDQWVLWKWEQRVNNSTEELKWTKPPYQTGGQLAGSDDPREWTPFDQTIAAFKRGGFASLGYVLTIDREPADELPGTSNDGLAGVDHDGVVDLETGAITAWAQDIVDRLASYTEISPSGTGLRIFLCAKLPPQYRRHARLGFECYEDGRYLTVTGNHLVRTPPRRNGGRPRGAVRRAEQVQARITPALGCATHRPGRCCVAGDSLCRQGRRQGAQAIRR